MRTKRKSETVPAVADPPEEAPKKAKKTPAAKKPAAEKPAKKDAAEKPAKKAAAEKPAKKAKVADEGTAPVVDAKAGPANDSGKSTIIVEASKECQCFAKRTEKLQAALKGIDSGISLSVNPEKPRKGTFELRSADGKVLFSLTGMPRPFTKLKALDADPGWDSVASDVVKELKA